MGLRVMVSVLAASVNALNIVLCAGTAIYAAKWLRIFREGMMEKGLQALLASVIFFLLAAIARAALIWGAIPPELDYVDITIRMVAFIFLFYSVVIIVNQWSNYGKADKNAKPPKKT